MFCLIPKVRSIKGDPKVRGPGPCCKLTLSHTRPIHTTSVIGFWNTLESFTFCCLCQVCKASGRVLCICAADKGHRKWHRKLACIATVRRLVRTRRSSPTWKITTWCSWFEPPNVFSLRMRTTNPSCVLCRYVGNFQPCRSRVLHQNFLYRYAFGWILASKERVWR